MLRADEPGLRTKDNDENENREIRRNDGPISVVAVYLEAAAAGLNADEMPLLRFCRCFFISGQC
jgi:hypothetical protein